MIATYVTIVCALFVYIALESISSRLQERRRIKRTADRYQRYVREYDQLSTAPDGSCAWCGHPEPNNHVCKERV